MKRHIVLLLVIFVAGVGFWIGRPLVGKFVYARHRAHASAVVESLAKKRPSDASPEVWEVAEFWIVTSFHNVFFSPGTTPIEELDRFAADIEGALTNEVTLKTVDWYWGRIADSGPAGKRYFDKFEPQYREQLKTALAKPGN